MNKAKKALTLYLIVTVFWPLAALAGEKQGKNQPQKARKAPKKKRAHLDTKGAVRGSGFRVSWIHPMRGNFAEYDKLEIVSLRSAVGDRVPAKEMEKYTQDLLRSFQKSGAFKRVRRVNEALLDAPAAAAPLTPPATAAPARSPLGAPLVAIDPASLPQESQQAVLRQAPAPKRTMIITGQVIYYKKGNRGLRVVALGLGYHRIVVRLHIYDKGLGQELAMGNISGEVSGGFTSIPFLTGDADGRKQAVVALVNRVEVRRAKADQ